MLALTMALTLGTAPELLPMPRVADPRDLIRPGMTQKEVEWLLPRQSMGGALNFGSLSMLYVESRLRVVYVKGVAVSVEKLKPPR